jgi:two-component system sensor histidine kinase CreC
MLTLSALENKKQLTQEESVDPAALVKDALESKQPLILSKNIHVTKDIPDDLRVAGDSFWLHQAIDNLLQNAIDFSLPDGAITISAHMDGETVKLLVEDSGTSIPEYALDKVFDKFYSLKRPDSGRKSTGLGLNLVRQVALLHKGDVRLENRQPLGVRAILTLPATAAA